VQACPDAAIVAQEVNEQTERSIRGLRMLVKVATSGVALYKSFRDVRTELVKIRECVKVGDEPIVAKLDRLVTIFSQSV
jgi:hypothetical protein